MNRIRAAAERVWYGVGTWTALLWVGAISLVGIESFAVIMGFAGVYPEILPFVILGLGVLYYVRRRLRRPDAPEPQAPADED